MKYTKMKIAVLSFLTLNCIAIYCSEQLLQFPLHDIIKNQDYATKQKLQLMQGVLDKKTVDINEQNDDGKTALNFVTFYKGDPAVAELLIEYGANVQTPDRFNQTPLHNAITYDEIEIARMLLEKGADPRFKNDAGLTSIDLARSQATQDLLGFK